MLRIDPEMWRNPQWVATIMLFPLVEPRTNGVKRAAERGSTAGDVLAILYAMDTLELDSPSLKKAETVVMEFSAVPADAMPIPSGKGRWDKVPNYRSEIQRRCRDFRPVWHLWAAARFMADDRTIRGEPLPTFKDHIHFLEFLSSARTVQLWAQDFWAKQGRGEPLLPQNVYLVPEWVAPVPLFDPKPSSDVLPRFVHRVLAFYGKKGQAKLRRGKTSDDGRVVRLERVAGK